MDSANLQQCYNRGCGLKYDPSNNNADICCHHPGLPFFHDGYKGWSCCNKKCINFTDFLNIKGCTLSKHSNIKPEEPEEKLEVVDKEVVEIKPLISAEPNRPPIDTPMLTMKPEISQSLKQQVMTSNLQSTKINDDREFGIIPVGTSCKNKGCTTSYQSTASNDTECIYHSGVPIFHEGLKYWSCCQHKTTDFDVFLNQTGCSTGKHTWFQEDDKDDQVVNCRWDWHQTGSYVVISIYAKNYCIDSTIVQLNPIRLFANLVFPRQCNSTFTLDLELNKVIDVKSSQVYMFATKVEIKLKKTSPHNWSKVDIPKLVVHKNKDEVKSGQVKHEPVDLCDL